jgi:hypothetical protein
MSNDHRSAPRRRRYAGIIGAALVATALGASAVAAQNASPAPNPGGTQVTPVEPGHDGWQIGPIRIGPDGITFEQGGRGGSGGRGGVIQVGPDGAGGMDWGGLGGGDFGMGHLMAGVRGLVKVTAVNGATVSLQTDDGWSKDIDTSNVVITRDGNTLAVGDLAVGDTVQVDQTRNANGTYTVTGLEVVMPQVIGRVASVGTDSFTINTMTGGTTTVHVTGSTTWQTPGSTATGLAALTVGDLAVAQGKLEADGSMDASSVMAGGMSMRMQRRMGGQGGSGPVAPAPATSPAASPATNG